MPNWKQTMALNAKLNNVAMNAKAKKIMVLNAKLGI